MKISNQLSLFLSANPDFTPNKQTKLSYNCIGRSMIEMLGVLAIIGVLSVGYIAVNFLEY